MELYNTNLRIEKDEESIEGFSLDYERKLLTQKEAFEIFQKLKPVMDNFYQEWDFIDFQKTYKVLFIV